MIRNSKTGHLFDLDNKIIIDKKRNNEKRMILESTHIQLHWHKACNIKMDKVKGTIHSLKHRYTFRIRISQFRSD